MQDRHGHNRESPVEHQEDAERTKASLLRGKAERAEAVQHAESSRGSNQCIEISEGGKTEPDFSVPEKRQ